MYCGLATLGAVRLGLHAAEDDQLDEHTRWNFAGRVAGVDGLDSGGWIVAGPASLDSAGRVGRVATAALHGDRLHVSSAVSSGGLQDDYGYR